MILFSLLRLDVFTSIFVFWIQEREYENISMSFLQGSDHLLLCNCTLHGTRATILGGCLVLPYQT